LPAIMLASGSATVPAFANECGFAGILARRVAALARPRDLLSAISTSGRSPNVVAAAHAAHILGCAVAAFTVAAEEPLAAEADTVIAAQSVTTARIREVRAPRVDAVCETLDARLPGEQR
jgi:D-sedoheptulose 7-phosphate isomerase